MYQPCTSPVRCFGARSALPGLILHASVALLPCMHVPATLLAAARDLKPANLMISGNLHADVEQLYLDSGVVKVADFGLSKSLVPVDRHGQMSMSLTQVGGVCVWGAGCVWQEGRQIRPSWLGKHGLSHDGWGGGEEGWLCLPSKLGPRLGGVVLMGIGCESGAAALGMVDVQVQVMHCEHVCSKLHTSSALTRCHGIRVGAEPLTQRQQLGCPRA